MKATSLRPTVIGLLCTLIAALASCGAESGAITGGDRPAIGPDDRPNVVTIVIDDATAEMIGPGSMPIASSRLFPESTSLTNFVVPSPLCCPSRAGLLTGQYGHNNGVLFNSYGRLDRPDEVLPAWLQNAGYETVHVGKFLNDWSGTIGGKAPIAPGWDRWFTLIDNQFYDYTVSDDGKLRKYGHSREDYVTTVINRRAEEFVRTYDGAEPFYLQIDHFAPHRSPEKRRGRCRTGAWPARGDMPGKRLSRTFFDRRARDERRIGDKPRFVRLQKRIKPKKQALIEREYACARASLAEIDRGIGTLLDALEDRDELDDTAILFTSDNGQFYGEHRIPGKKEFPYEENLRMPLWVKLPDSLAAAAPAETGELTAMIDIAPTILELADAESCIGAGECRTIDGRSMLPLLDGSRTDWPEPRSVLIELDQLIEVPKHRVRSCSYIGVRTRDEVLIRHRQIAVFGKLCRPSKAEELYDLASDPAQNRNLIDKPLSQPDAEALREKMGRLASCAGNVAAADPGPNPCE